MYQCLGESAFAPGEQERTIAEVKANPPKRDDTAALGKATALRPSQPGDSLRIRSYILDGDCHFIKEFAATLPDPGRPLKELEAWDGKDAQGYPLATGVYLINVESTHADARKDTSYAKVRLIRDLCLAVRGH